MALTSDGSKLIPLLELSLTGSDPKTIFMHEFDIATRKYTGKRYLYRFDARGTNIGDFILFDETHGLVIERDPSQGDLKGFKQIFEVELQGAGQAVKKTRAVDLMNIKDTHRLSEPVLAGDVGTGFHFAFPFNTIEDVVVFDHKHIGVIDDNNFPFGVGRHAGSGKPDDNEFIIIELDQPLANGGNSGA